MNTSTVDTTRTSSEAVKSGAKSPKEHPSHRQEENSFFPESIGHCFIPPGTGHKHKLTDDKYWLCFRFQGNTEGEPRSPMALVSTSPFPRRHRNTHLLRPPGPGGVFNKNHQAKKHVVCVQHPRHHPQRQSVQVFAQEAEQSHSGHTHPELRFLLVPSNLFFFIFGRTLPVKYCTAKEKVRTKRSTWFIQGQKPST